LIAPARITDAHGTEPPRDSQVRSMNSMAG
jgi:hypothetical protein